MTKCSTCGGVMVPSYHKDEPKSCILCGRNNEPPVDQAALIAQAKRKVMRDRKTRYAAEAGL